LLQSPYPFTSKPAKRITTIVLIAVFVFLFLYFFRPFGMNNISGNILLITLGYGGVTLFIGLFITVLIPTIFKKYFTEEKWTTAREVAFTLLIILLISSGNFIYSWIIKLAPFNISAFIAFILFTTAVAIIPVFITVIIKQNILLRRNLANAIELSESLYHKKRMPGENQLITIRAENPKDNLQVLPQNIILLKAAENYVEVYLFQNSKIECKLIRTTLKSAHDDLKTFSQFYRCHRTYIINLEKVERVTGNAQGFRLVISNIEESIPVSRALNKDITQRLKR